MGQDWWWRCVGERTVLLRVLTLGVRRWVCRWVGGCRLLVLALVLVLVLVLAPLLVLVLTLVLVLAGGGGWWWWWC